MSVTLPVGRPPADLSGGLMVVRFSAASRPITMMRLHVSAFNRVTKDYSGGPGTEANVHDTFVNLCTTGTGQGGLAKFFSEDTRIELVSMWQRQGDGSLKKIAPVINGDDGQYYYTLGTNTGVPSLVEGYTQNILNFETETHNRARVRLVTAVGLPVREDTWAFGDGGGTDMQKLVNYLVASTTQIVGKDGHTLRDPVHITSTLVKRLRSEQQRT